MHFRLSLRSFFFKYFSCGVRRSLGGGPFLSFWCFLVFFVVFFCVCLCFLSKKNNSCESKSACKFFFWAVFRQKLLLLEGLASRRWSHCFQRIFLRRMVSSNHRFDHFLTFFRILVPKTYIK